MSKFFLIIFLSLALFDSCKKKLDNVQSAVSLTKQEKYILTIDQNRISKPRDTVVFWGKKKYSYVIAPIKLSNISNDTLVYLTMTCSTFEVFTTNNKNVEVELQPCESNTPSNFTILPHHSSITNLSLFFPKNPENNKYRFEAGIYLCTGADACSVNELFDRNKWATELIIWSNDVVVSKS